MGKMRTHGSEKKKKPERYVRVISSLRTCAYVRFRKTLTVQFNEKLLPFPSAKIQNKCSERVDTSKRHFPCKECKQNEGKKGRKNGPICIVLS